MKDMKTQIETDLIMYSKCAVSFEMSEDLYWTFLQTRAQNLRIITENHSSRL